jgi:nitroreductase
MTNPPTPTTPTTLIPLRRSTRTYTPQPLAQPLKDKINSFIHHLPSKWSASPHIMTNPLIPICYHYGTDHIIPILPTPPRISLISTQTPDAPVKLGTYGFISGASDFLTLVCPNTPFADEAGGYLLEQVILFCTSLGLGTCWLGGSFNRKDFKQLIHVGPNEKLRIVSPVGYKSNKKRWTERLQGADKHHASRKPFGSLFFHKNLDTPLSPQQAGIYAQPLEMVRLAPSANNGQPWRIVLNNNTLHFFRKPTLGGFSTIDMGIALCHFEQTCIELGIKGHFEILRGIQNKNLPYCISWLQ